MQTVDADSEELMQCVQAQDWRQETGNKELDSEIEKANLPDLVCFSLGLLVALGGIHSQWWRQSTLFSLLI